MKSRISKKTTDRQILIIQECDKIDDGDIDKIAEDISLKSSESITFEEAKENLELVRLYTSKVGFAAGTTSNNNEFVCVFLSSPKLNQKQESGLLMILQNTKLSELKSRFKSSIDITDVLK